jgi:hypothetical protein
MEFLQTSCFNVFDIQSQNKPNNPVYQVENIAGHILMVSSDLNDIQEQFNCFELEFYGTQIIAMKKDFFHNPNISFFGYDSVLAIHPEKPIIYVQRDNFIYEYNYKTHVETFKFDGGSRVDMCFPNLLIYDGGMLDNWQYIQGNWIRISVMHFPGHSKLQFQENEVWMYNKTCIRVYAFEFDRKGIRRIGRKKKTHGVPAHFRTIVDYHNGKTLQVYIDKSQNLRNMYRQFPKKLRFQESKKAFPTEITWWMMSNTKRYICVYVSINHAYTKAYLLEIDWENEEFKEICEIGLPTRDYYFFNPDDSILFYESKQKLRYILLDRQPIQVKTSKLSGLDISKVFWTSKTSKTSFIYNSDAGSVWLFN